MIVATAPLTDETGCTLPDAAGLSVYSAALPGAALSHLHPTRTVSLCHYISSNHINHNPQRHLTLVDSLRGGRLVSGPWL